MREIPKCDVPKFNNQKQPSFAPTQEPDPPPLYDEWKGNLKGYLNAERMRKNLWLVQLSS
ncbi:hypothetical protein K440DRAFT_619943 [Wilcoxina mikolae CBS 423.85]|nr:hypothetical protein K440DRAFT_619943 [Wilcoxina mikolae CBS 423.85]